MKPETIKKISQFDFDTLSTDELGGLIDALTELHKERVNRDKRRRKAEEYEIKIYDLLSEALQDNFNILIGGGPHLTKNFTVDVFD